MSKKSRVLKIAMIVAWCIEGVFFISGFISEKLLALTGYSVPLLIIPIVLTVIYSKEKRKSNSIKNISNTTSEKNIDSLENNSISTFDKSVSMCFGFDEDKATDVSLTRNITLVRPNRFPCSAVGLNVYIDGEKKRKLNNGAEISFELDSNPHMIEFDAGVMGSPDFKTKLAIPGGISSYRFQMDFMEYRKAGNYKPMFRPIGEKRVEDGKRPYIVLAEAILFTLLNHNIRNILQKDKDTCLEIKLNENTWEINLVEGTKISNIMANPYPNRTGGFVNSAVGRIEASAFESEDARRETLTYLYQNYLRFLPGLVIRKQGEEKKATVECVEFDSLMTGQLIAFYKKENDEKYMNEYIRRLTHIGFNKNEAFNLFTNESMNMKNESISLLQRSTYITDSYFNLKNKILPFDNEYYIEHRMFSVSEITKIWDEAEWHYHNSHDENIPDDVWHEIYMLTRYGSGELFVETLNRLAESAHISIDKIQKYAMSEQNMLFKYKWNKLSNEQHPYH